MDLGLAGKGCVVTGAGRGIGRDVARRLSAEGANVLLVARTESDLEETAQACETAGGSATPLPLDVTDPDAHERIIETAGERFGSLDVIVNSAGSATWRALDEVPDSEWQA